MMPRWLVTIEALSLLAVLYKLSTCDTRIVAAALVCTASAFECAWALLLRPRPPNC